ncbi:MAG: hypothetical protein NXI13_15765 [Proteobacteria bacterium]|nr:hypothetical protein [Pseudomonadota bacterium]
MLEILYLCLEKPFPEESKDKMISVLAMYGYSLLGNHELTSGQKAKIPAPEDRSFIHALIVHNLHPNIAESFGQPLNTNLFKAVKGVMRKFKELDPHVVSPGCMDEHARQLEMMEFSDIEVLSSLAMSNEENFNSPFQVLDCISDNNSRTRIDKILFRGEPAVCKTFRQTSLDALEKEILARKVLSANVPEIAPVLEHGDNYFIMPYYEAVWTWQADSFSLFPLDYAEKCLDIMRRIQESGWSVVDWHPGNFIYLPDGDVVMIDLEALTENTAEEAFESSADILGHRDFPYQDKPINYMNTWQPIVGLSLKSLLYDSPSKKRCVRTFYFLGRALPTRLIKKLEQALRKPVKKLVSRRQIRRLGPYLVYRF